MYGWNDKYISYYYCLNIKKIILKFINPRGVIYTIEHVFLNNSFNFVVMLFMIVFIFAMSRSYWTGLLELPCCAVKWNRGRDPILSFVLRVACGITCIVGVAQVMYESLAVAALFCSAALCTVYSHTIIVFCSTLHCLFPYHCCVLQPSALLIPIPLLCSAALCTAYSYTFIVFCSTLHCLLPYLYCVLQHCSYTFGTLYSTYFMYYTYVCRLRSHVFVFFLQNPLENVIVFC